MAGILEHMPLQTIIMVPLFDLPKFPAHKQQFLSGLSVHAPQQQAQISEPLPLITRHFSNERSFPVDDFIVRERQYEVLCESIKHAEGQRIVMVLSVDRLLL